MEAHSVICEVQTESLYVTAAVVQGSTLKFEGQVGEGNVHSVSIDEKLSCPSLGNKTTTKCGGRRRTINLDEDELSVWGSDSFILVSTSQQI
jgi:hypothetical protein